MHALGDHSTMPSRSPHLYVFSWRFSFQGEPKAKDVWNALAKLEDAGFATHRIGSLNINPDPPWNFYAYILRTVSINAVEDAPPIGSGRLLRDNCLEHVERFEATCKRPRLSVEVPSILWQRVVDPRLDAPRAPQRDGVTPHERIGRILDEESE